MSTGSLSPGTGVLKVDSLGASRLCRVPAWKQPRSGVREELTSRIRGSPTRARDAVRAAAALLGVSRKLLDHTIGRYQ